MSEPRTWLHAKMTAHRTALVAIPLAAMLNFLMSELWAPSTGGAERAYWLGSVWVIACAIWGTGYLFGAAIRIARPRKGILRGEEVFMANFFVLLFALTAPVAPLMSLTA